MPERFTSPLMYDCLEKLKVLSEKTATRYMFEDDKKSRVALTKNERGIPLNTDLILVIDFITSALATQRHRARQLSIGQMKNQIAAFSVIVPSGFRTTTETCIEYASKKTKELNRLSIGLRNIPPLYLVVTKPAPDVFHRYAGELVAFEAQGTDIYPIVRDHIGNIGRFPVDAMFTPNPIIQKTGPFKERF